MSFLLDTNVLSEARRAGGNPGVKAFFFATSAGDLFASVLVLGELRRGVERLRRKDPRQATFLEEWLVALRSDFADRWLPVTGEVAEEWGRLSVPDALPTIDGLMATIAKLRGLTFVTRNSADVQRTGIALLNPFS